MATDKQLRQRIDYAIARTESMEADVLASRAHLQIIRDELTERIDAPVPVPEPQPEPEPEPEPQPEPEPDTGWDGAWSFTASRAGTTVPGTLVVDFLLITFTAGGQSAEGTARIDGASLTASLSHPTYGTVGVDLQRAGDALSGTLTAQGESFTVSGARAGTEEPVPPIDPPTDPGPVPEPTPGATWTHSWSQYTDTAAMLRDSVRLTARVWANTGGSLELAREGGTAFLRTNWGGGPYVGAINDEQIALDVNLPSQARSTEVTLDLPLRYSSNFRVESDHKTLFVFTEDGQRWEWRFGAHRIRAQAKIDNGNVAIWSKGGREVDVTNPPVIWDGKWHHLRLHLKSGSGGRFRAWLDGELMVDAPVSMRSSRFATVALSRNGDPATRSTLDWGDVGVTVGAP